MLSLYGGDGEMDIASILKSLGNAGVGAGPDTSSPFQPNSAANPMVNYIGAMGGGGGAQVVQQPSWWGNPVGTQTNVSMGVPRGDFDPVIGTWPGGKPMTRAEHEGIKQKSIDLYDKLVGMVGGARVLSSLPGSGRMSASRSVGVTPPSKPQQAIGDYYPKGVPLDAAGNLARTPEGVALTAKNIAGRRAVGNEGTFPDRGLDPATIESIGTGPGGARILGVPKRQLPGDTVGTYNPDTGLIRYDNSLPAPQQNVVISHEVSHAIDKVAGNIPTKGLNTELRRMYNTLLGDRERTTALTGPEQMKYKGDDVPKELMAEAIRAYMHDPNYIKTMAPNTAKIIRSRVNIDPTLSKWIQFNSVAGIIAGAAGSGEDDR